MATEREKPNELSHRLLLSMNDQITELVGDVKSIRGTVDRIVPLVDKHEDRHNQAKGAMHLGKGVWQFIFSGGIGAALVEAGQFLFGNGHPPHHP